MAQWEQFDYAARQQFAWVYCAAAVKCGFPVLDWFCLPTGVLFARRVVGWLPSLSSFLFRAFARIYSLPFMRAIANISLPLAPIHLRGPRRRPGARI